MKGDYGVDGQKARPDPVTLDLKFGGLAGSPPDLAICTSLAL